MYISVLFIDIHIAEDTMHRSSSEVTEIESISDSKGTSDNCTENDKTVDQCEMPVRKRKRTRRKRPIKKTQQILADVVNEKLQTSKYQPKSSGSIPTGKHIRFDHMQTNIVGEIDNLPNNLSTRKPNVSEFDASSLSTLLALRKSSSPLTFASKKVHSQNDHSFVDNECTIKSSNSRIDCREINNEPSVERSDVNNGSVEDDNYSQLTLEKYPILHSSTELNDIIAFKVSCCQKFRAKVRSYTIDRVLITKNYNIIWCWVTVLD